MILIIDNFDSFTYNLYQYVAQMHDQVKVVRNNKITIDEINQLKPSGIILSPGPGRPENAGICIELIKQLGNKIPILGVCLGHQAISIAFGGKVIQAPEIIHGKTAMIFHYRKGLYQKLTLPCQAGRYHSLIVDRATLPNDLMIEAESSDGIIMGMRHIRYPLFGVQFHPESVLTPKGDQLLKEFVEHCTK